MAKTMGKVNQCILRAITEKLRCIDADSIIMEFFSLLLHKYQVALEKSIKGSGFLLV